MNQLAKIVGKCIKQSRENVGFTLQQVAKRMGMKAAYIQKWEDGEQLPSCPRFKFLAPMLKKEEFLRLMSDTLWERYPEIKETLTLEEKRALAYLIGEHDFTRKQQIEKDLFEEIQEEYGPLADLLNLDERERLTLFEDPVNVTAMLSQNAKEILKYIARSEATRFMSMFHLIEKL